MTGFARIMPSREYCGQTGPLTPSRPGWHEDGACDLAYAYFRLRGQPPTISRCAGDLLRIARSANHERQDFWDCASIYIHPEEKLRSGLDDGASRYAFETYWKNQFAQEPAPLATDVIVAIVHDRRWLASRDLYGIRIKTMSSACIRDIRRQTSQPARSLLSCYAPLEAE